MSLFRFEAGTLDIYGIIALNFGFDALQRLGV